MALRPTASQFIAACFDPMRSPGNIHMMQNTENVTRRAGAHCCICKQKEQWFYYYAECFRKIADDDSVLYILKPDMSTIGECDEENLQETLDAAASTRDAL